MSVVDSIIKHEGFRSTPYPDPILGWDKPTFGHGLTYITPGESRFIVERRVRFIRLQLQEMAPWIQTLPREVQDVLVEMAYQLGVNGLFKFKRMLTALERYDFETAADEMLDSRWAHQTPERARQLAEVVRHASAAGSTAT